MKSFIFSLLTALLLATSSTTSMAATTSVPGACSPLPGSTTQQDYAISDCRIAAPGTYTFQYVHVIQGGTLLFADEGGVINFNAQSILVEKGGTIRAGSYDKPFGLNGGKLVIGLYGAGPTNIQNNPVPSYAPIQCIQTFGAQKNPCFPVERIGKGCINAVSGFVNDDPCQQTLAANHSQDNTYFEGYAAHSSMGDGSTFGYKVLAVSYGGSLELFGAKGVAPQYRTNPNTSPGMCPVPKDSDQHDITKWAALTGDSWVRAGATTSGATVQLDRAVDWAAGDKLIIGTTDWSTSHSELVSIASVPTPGTNNQVTLSASLQYPHNGSAYSVPQDLLTQTGNPNSSVENRAAIGLLTRSITIKSLGATATAAFPAASACGVTANNPDCYFGAHTMVRQGFANFQVQGVEFYQMGQGGNIGHYPVHFHMAKDTSYTHAFIKDSSIWESNTRFITVHATHNVEISRNVGYLSMGHGFYVEDGSEINNRFCQNLGVSARAPFIDYFQNQDADSPQHRAIPPILSTVQDGSIQGSDAIYPSMFWIMNGYNEFVGNQAVGVHGFGACYWPLSSSVSGPSTSLHWARSSASPPAYQTYSDLDYANFNVAGSQQAPLKRFRGNGCTTAAFAFMTERASLQPGTANFASFSIATSATPPATPPAIPTPGSPPPVLVAANPYTIATGMLPNIESNFQGIKHAISPDPNPTCTTGYAPGTPSTNGKYCVATVIDHFTTSFNWAQANFGSVWLRPWSYVFINGAMTDQLFGGLGFVSGGSWNQELDHQLDIVKDSIFVGSVSPDDPHAGKNGPDMSKAICSPNLVFCYFQKDGTGLYSGDFNPKRMLTIYDGPFFSDGNIFTQVNPPAKAANILIQPGSTPPYAAGTTIYNSTNQPASPVTGKATQFTTIDAAIGWKQPNGFYYPPVFAFRKSGFDSNAERHNVLDQYDNYVMGQLWGAPIIESLSKVPSVTPIDATTILNDLDGTLNGMTPSSGSPRTSGLSNNHFYDAPYAVSQCNSFGTQTIPHDFVTTVITGLTAPLSSAATSTTTQSAWSNGANVSPAVAIYRQLETASTGDQCSANTQVCGIGQTTNCCPRGTLFMGAQLGAAPGLTMNQSTYYIDTDTPADAPTGYTPPSPFQVASFQANATYLIHQLYATTASKVSYQVYVGPNYQASTGQWARLHPHTYGQTGNNIQVSLAGKPLGTTSYNAATGILNVTLDNSTVKADYAFPIEKDDDACFPSNLCEADTATKQCKLSKSFTEAGLKGAVGEICSYWSSRTTGESKDGVFLNDCPRGGCIGFSFTLPANFTPSPYSTSGQPLASCYPQTAPWTISLTQKDKACATPPTQGNFCTPPKP